jgi:putative long chain acyl-CoA synthase
MPVNDALGAIDAVDMSVTYAIESGGQRVAVTAVALRPGGSVAAGDLSEALADLPVGAAPDIVHVVPEMALSASYRPLISPLRAMGIPKPSRNAWYLDSDTDRYKRLTAAVRNEIVGGE